MNAKLLEIQPPVKIKVANIPDKGRGIVATEKISSGEIIENCPIVLLRNIDQKFIKGDSDTLRYYYLQLEDIGSSCIILGYGSLYNHSVDPNAEIDHEDGVEIDHICYRAIKDIAVGEEITWDYNFDDNIVEFLPTEK